MLATSSVALGLVHSPVGVPTRASVAMNIGDINFESVPWSSSEASNKADMMALAKKQCPPVGFWDPLEIVSGDVKPETIGWYRHAEIKHGRVAMAAFVGFTVQSLGVCFPWDLQV